jgi:hypothetical protein
MFWRNWGMIHHVIRRTLKRLRVGIRITIVSHHNLTLELMTQVSQMIHQYQQTHFIRMLLIIISCHICNRKRNLHLISLWFKTWNRNTMILRRNWINCLKSMKWLRFRFYLKQLKRLTHANLLTLMSQIRSQCLLITILTIQFKQFNPIFQIESRIALHLRKKVSVQWEQF